MWNTIAHHQSSPDDIKCHGEAIGYTLCKSQLIPIIFPTIPIHFPPNSFSGKFSGVSHKENIPEKKGIITAGKIEIGVYL